MYDIDLLPTDWADEFDGRTWTVEADRPVRYAVVGYSSFAEGTMLPAFADSNLGEVSVVVTSSPDQTERRLDDASVERVIDYEAFRDGEATDAYDAAYVATPNGTHLEHARTAAEHGKHVLCEKPLEADLDRAERLVDCCSDNGVLLRTANRVRHKPTIIWVRSLVRKGVIGDPVQIHSDVTFDLLEAGGEDQWRMDDELAGGGVLMDIGVYPVNTIRYVLDAEPTAVEAELRADDPFDRVEEHANFKLSFGDRATAVCTASYGAAPANHLRIVGTDGDIFVQWPYTPVENATVRVTNTADSVTVSPDEANELVQLVDYFSKAVADDDFDSPDGSDGLRDMVVLDALYEAAERDERVELPRLADD